ncbi:MAG: PIN domain-containing protein [Hyphomonadaceae bacterium]
MIAVDTSVLVDWLDQIDTPQTRRVSGFAQTGAGVIAAVTITELLSDPRGSRAMSGALVAFPILPVAQGYWERAGLLRAKVRKAGRKAALGDALIAQACIDADLPLLTSDTDFAAFVKLGGLKLA